MSEKLGMPLFSGKFARDLVLMPYPKMINGQYLPPEILPLGEITLLLPYYREAEKIMIQDEQGNNKLTVALSDYSLTSVESYTKYCGNGICDTDENILSCYSDCRILIESRIKHLFNKQ